MDTTLVTRILPYNGIGREKENDVVDLATRLEKLPDLLRERCERYRVPGAALGVLHDGQIFETATGVLNKATGVEVTTDSVF